MPCCVATRCSLKVCRCQMTVFKLKFTRWFFFHLWFRSYVHSFSQPFIFSSNHRNASFQDFASLWPFCSELPEWIPCANLRLNLFFCRIRWCSCFVNWRFSLFWEDWCCHELFGETVCTIEMSPRLIWVAATPHFNDCWLIDNDFRFLFVFELYDFNSVVGGEREKKNW